ncbi:MAG: tRNA 2-thiouridine(34) synthase MnmA [Kofleriaceae bacterium]|nr:tRNA 2-thiouridine(34) synthase MnmA [Kofleriaceae bacterium]
MSGGVDSATAAALLVRAGHEVVGMTMRLYDAAGTAAGRGRCCGPRDLDDARRVAEALGVPHYVIDLEEAFTRAVVDDFVDTYLAGATPNPCVRCNQHIKFTPLLARARAVGAAILATGHYARIAPGPDGAPALHRAVDPDKDQSYFLFSMPAAALAAVWFPLGDLAKGEVRAIAGALGLPVAGKPESHEICFVPDGDHAGFVARAALARGRPLPAAGDIVDAGGRVLGRHAGTHRFRDRPSTAASATCAACRRGAPGRHRRSTPAGAVGRRRRSGAGGAPRAGARRRALARPAGGGTWRCSSATAARPGRRRSRPTARARHATAARARRGGCGGGASGQAAVLSDGARVVGGGWIAV